ncbi:DUF397 domain-containing protein [Streptomyces sp. NPDC020298]|uniref:DUF397 domain-containing protein n=1 Tax=unclassified Streptomyces TaxID=2593676 RepID=UPI0033D6EC75
MQAEHWQKSSFSGDSSNCIYVAAAPTGTIHLRESEEPDIILTTTQNRLRTLIRHLKDTSDPSPTLIKAD